MAIGRPSRPGGQVSRKIGRVTDPAPDLPDHLTIRPPRQERSRRAWARVLEAGVTLLEEAGYDGFTIAAVCDRAQVPPRAVYDRAPSKDALFLAVYEHGMARIRADHQVFDDSARWQGLSATALIEAAVREVAAVFSRHQALLRAVVLISGVHPEVNRRGSLYSRELGGRFTALLRPLAPQISHPGTDADTVLRTCFTTVFSALVIRVAYGPGFAADPVDDATYTSQLARMSSLYLLTRRQLPAT
jgi:AcrR family transcriptional regulator